jgi:hypothetical protein
VELTRAARPRRLLSAGGLLLAGALAFADAVGYREIKDVREENDVLSVEHHHDWSRATEAARFKMITTTKDPFTAENTYSYLRVIEKASGRELFRAPVPALTRLWISPDSRYVVGLSTIKLWNPYQLVVFNRAGRRLYERDFTGESPPAVIQSTTNAILWFQEPDPSIRIEERGGSVQLSIEDRLGKPRLFRFKAAP